MTSGNDIAFASAEALVELYRNKALSPVEAADMLLARAEALQPRLNAFCFLDRDGALAAARAAERRWRPGEPLERDRRRAGDDQGHRADARLPDPARVAPRFDPRPMSEDGPAVARLREDGAVILGKTTSPEFGWKAIGDSPLTGITRNPWNLDRTPGGSSAGAAAACAAGIAPLACRQRRGRLDPHPGVLFRHLRHQGDASAGCRRIRLADGSPLQCRADDARTVARRGADAEVLGAPRSRAIPTRCRPHDRDFRAGIEDGVSGMRVAFSPDLGYARVDPEIAAAVRRRGSAIRGPRRDGRGGARGLPARRATR